MGQGEEMMGRGETVRLSPSCGRAVAPGEGGPPGPSWRWQQEPVPVARRSPTAALGSPGFSALPSAAAPLLVAAPESPARHPRPAAGLRAASPATSPPACERRRCCWARRMWVTARCPPRLPTGGPPRPEQVAPGLGGSTVAVSSSPGSRAGKEGTRHPPRSNECPPGPLCSEDAAGAPSAGATPGRDGNRPRRRGPRRKQLTGWGGGGDTTRHTGASHGASQRPSFSRARVKDFLQAPLILSADIGTG